MYQYQYKYTSIWTWMNRNTCLTWSSLNFIYESKIILWQTNRDSRHFNNKICITILQYYRRCFYILCGLMEMWINGNVELNGIFFCVFISSECQRTTDRWWRSERMSKRAGWRICIYYICSPVVFRAIFIDIFLSLCCCWFFFSYRRFPVRWKYNNSLPDTIYDN